MTIVIEKPDLSFTDKPEWIEEREKLWEKYCEGQYAELRKEKLRIRKDFFFTGEFERPRDNGRGQTLFLKARINDFPLRRPEGWSYVVYKFGGFNEFEMTKLLVHLVLPSLKELGWSLEEELALWDYFLPSTYKPTVRSPGPTKKHGAPIEGSLPLDSIIRQYALNLHCLLVGYSEISRKYFYRSDFLISTLRSIDSEELNKGSDLSDVLKSLFSEYYWDRSKLPDDCQEAFGRLMTEVEELIESGGVDSSVKEIWDEVKQKEG
ncbi:hypothetical protein [Saccharospirillum salsuginis]|uniref:Uncharacterized protein n=1 Tax=Saccharospirillum salsuginis TaxID=418750 RepID=A0A918K9L1_9GAMM|nr:hypothetical protein [Saccharospirillum salsuginis]GGX56051.1 hypothetical protein GCM10007392_24800 [Saccharospirillum salsuginis]